MLEERGARALSAPAIEYEPQPEMADAVRRLAAETTFDWVVFTSRAGVEAVFDGPEVGTPWGPARVAAVGEGTARALQAHGATADLVPSAFTTAALGRTFPRGQGNVLLVRADIAPLWHEISPTSTAGQFRRSGCRCRTRGAGCDYGSLRSLRQ